jgi:hypothetical protein
MRLACVWLVLWACAAAQEPVCNPTQAADEGLQSVTLFGLKQYALALASRSGASPYVLLAVEWATAETRSLVPFEVVVRALGSPDGLQCALVGTAGQLFVVRDLVLGGVAAVSDRAVVVEPSSVQFSPDSSLLGYLLRGGELMVSGGRGLVSRAAEAFEFSSDASFVVFSNATGLHWASLSGNDVRLLVSGAVTGGFAISDDAQLVAVAQANVVSLVSVNGSVVQQSVAGNRVFGWSSTGVAVYQRSDGQIWGSSENASFALSGGLRGENVVISGVWCVFRDANDASLHASNTASLASVALSSGVAVSQFVVAEDGAGAAFVTMGGELWRAVPMTDSAVLVAPSVDRVASLAANGVLVFVSANGTALLSAPQSAVQLVSRTDQNVSALAVQPNGVSVAFVVQRSLFVGCLVPPTFLAPGEVLGVSRVPGHLFAGNESRIPSGTEVGGTAVLSAAGVVAQLQSCDTSSTSAPYDVRLLNATLIVGEFASVSGCAACVVMDDVAYLSTSAVVHLNPSNCAPFSWIVFGIVVGVSVVAVAVVGLVLFLWNKRAKRRAAANLERRELKYRAIGTLIPMN